MSPLEKYFHLSGDGISSRDTSKRASVRLEAWLPPGENPGCALPSHATLADRVSVLWPPPQTATNWGLKPQTCILLWLWRQGSTIGVSQGHAPCEGSGLWGGGPSCLFQPLLVAVSLHPAFVLMWPPLCLCLSYCVSCKHKCPWMQGTPQIQDLILRSFIIYLCEDPIHRF